MTVLTLLVAVSLTLGGAGVAGAAEPIAPTPDAAVAACAVESGPADAALFLPTPIEVSNCPAVAHCENGTVLQCTSSSGDCLGGDQDCDGWQRVRGGVSCDGNETLCPPCPCDYPSSSTCKSGVPCQSGCGNCGSGSCWQGTCNCLI